MKTIELIGKKALHTYIIVLSIVAILITVWLLMLKYHVEGEANLPFNVSKISVISTTKMAYDENKKDAWEATISQRNDVYFQIEKNSNYKKEEIIKKVVFNNFSINKENKLGEVAIYKPSDSDNAYNYSEETVIKESLEFIGEEITDTKLLEINNQGGLISFSIMNKNIGKYISPENTVIPSGKELLEKANINIEDIKFKVSFDMIIETEAEKKFKAEVVLELPNGDMEGTKTSSEQDLDLSKIVFKRF